MSSSNGESGITPAFVLNRTLDVLATNALADALFALFDRADNLARMTFLDPAGRHFYAQWDWTAQAVVANLRIAAGYADPALPGLVTELGAGSEQFRARWNAQAVRGKTGDPKHLIHPDVGPLTLIYQAFDVRSAPGQQLILYHAEPGTPSAHALALLSSLHAPTHIENNANS